MPGLSAIVGKALKVVDDLVQDKDQAARLKAGIAERLIEARASAVTAEARGSWLQRNWRPMTMMVFVFIIFNNYVLAPYVNAFGGNLPVLEIPNGMWALLTTGMGGYVLGRSGEKMVRSWRE